jgi:hypothetical protein
MQIYFRYCATNGIAGSDAEIETYRQKKTALGQFFYVIVKIVIV